MIDLQSIISVRSQQISCDLGDEAVILNLDTGEYFGLDPVGAQIWSWLKDPQTVVQLRDRLVEEYRADRDEIERDLIALLEQLVGEGLIDVTTRTAQGA